MEKIRETYLTPSQEVIPTSADTALCTSGSFEDYSEEDIFG